MNDRVMVGLKTIPQSMGEYRIGRFNNLEPDDVFLDPKDSQQCDLLFWFTQLESKLMGAPYYKVSGSGIYKFKDKK